MVVIDPHIAEYFPDHDSVNESLRSPVSIIKRRDTQGVFCAFAVRGATGAPPPLLPSKKNQ